MVNKYIFRRAKLCLFHFAGSTLKGNNLLPEEQIVSFKSRHILEGLHLKLALVGLAVCFYPINLVIHRLLMLTIRLHGIIILALSLQLYLP